MVYVCEKRKYIKTVHKERLPLYLNSTYLAVICQLRLEANSTHAILNCFRTLSETLVHFRYIFFAKKSKCESLKCTIVFFNNDVKMNTLICF